MGEMGGDLANLLTKEINRLPDETAIVVRQIYGKQRNENITVIFACLSEFCCIVEALDEYFLGVKSLGVDISFRYIFRKLDHRGRVLDQVLSQTS